MIAVDTSSLVAYLGGEKGPDVDGVEQALQQQIAVLPPVVLCELLSDPRLSPSVAGVIEALPRLEVLEGYWQRTGRLRAKVLGRGLRARLADALIAQSCIDHGVALVTRDADFRHFARAGRLRLAE